MFLGLTGLQAQFFKSCLFATFNSKMVPRYSMLVAEKELCAVLHNVLNRNDKNGCRHSILEVHAHVRRNLILEAQAHVLRTHGQPG